MEEKRPVSDESLTNSEKKKALTKTIAECAMLVAISCVLSLFPKFKFLGQGGSVTICSMLPIVIASYRHGLKWGFMAGFVFAVFQAMTGMSAAGLSVWSAVGMIFFDYFAAFTVLGIGGVFRGKLGNPGRELALGSFVALMLRYVCHTISGYIFFSEWAEWFFESTGAFGAAVLDKFSGNALSWVYSIVYNGSYMIPEIIITVIVAAIIGKYVAPKKPQE